LLHQGVLTRLPRITGRFPERNVRPATASTSFLAYPACREEQTCKRDDAQERTPSASIARGGMSVSLHSAPKILNGPRSSWRCGRDDSLNRFSRRMVLSSAKPLACTACRRAGHEETRGVG
jgi:hypothetical protein